MYGDLVAVGACVMIAFVFAVCIAREHRDYLMQVFHAVPNTFDVQSNSVDRLRYSSCCDRVSGMAHEAATRGGGSDHVDQMHTQTWQPTKACDTDETQQSCTWESHGSAPSGDRWSQEQITHPKVLW